MALRSARLSGRALRTTRRVREGMCMRNQSNLLGTCFAVLAAALLLVVVSDVVFGENLLITGAEALLAVFWFSSAVDVLGGH